MKAFTTGLTLIALSAFALSFASPVKISVGAAAPSFEIKDSKGNDVKLEDYKGKFVVLEWCNFGCPFVQKHYNTNNMQSLQKKYTQKGVVWLTIFSAAEGNHGYYSTMKLNQLAVEKKMSSKLIADSEGTIGKMYGAKNTPTMFIVDPKGHIAYMGGIDDTASSDPEDISKAKNYVAAALDEGLAGKRVSISTSRPYGCGIGYKN